MNTKYFVVIALALCLCMIAAPVTAAHARDENKYVERTAFDTQPVAERMAGTIAGNLRCGYSPLTPEIGIRNVKNVDGSPNTNGSYEYYNIKADGTFEIYPLAAGRYQLHVNDGNGGQPEDTFANVVPGKTSQPENEIKGHAFSGDGEQCKQLEIISAQYGKITTSIVIDVAEHTEYRYWIEATGHWSGPWWNRKFHIDTPAHWSEWSNTNPHKCGQQTRTVPTTYKTIVSGQYIDVTSIVQSLKTCKGLHITADYENLHYNALFTDPVPGTLKDLHITYILNGIDKEITVLENQDTNI
jgi:hypothetical protein